jgi:uncharacterized membrane protein SpoIIM required for sporulation
MNEARFVEEREPQWQRLRYLAEKADLSPEQLDSEEIIEFARLYRSASRDLAIVRSYSVNADLAAFLNDLVARAYGVLYRRPGKGLRRVATDMLWTGADVVRRRWREIAAAAGVFLLATIFAFATMAARPDLRSRLIDSEDENVRAWKSGRFDPRTASEAVAMTGFYSSNNPRVAMLTVAVAAATFGVGTFVLLWTNGLLLGSLGYEMHSVGKLDHLLVTIAPHAATEVTGIFVAGAGGFVLGLALIAPGRRSRGQALREAGHDAFALLVLAMAMMFLAAPVEGFLSFNPSVPDPVKALFAIITFAAWITYWTRYGRTRRDEASG